MLVGTVVGTVFSPPTVPVVPCSVLLCGEVLTFAVPLLGACDCGGPVGPLGLEGLVFGGDVPFVGLFFTMV